MSQNSNQLVERIIAEALRREIEDLSPPPPDQMWRRINLRLNQAAARRKRSLLFWKRIAAGTAAVLVLAVGAIGYYRSSRPVPGCWETAEAELAAEQADEVEDLLTAPAQERKVNPYDSSKSGRPISMVGTFSEPPAFIGVHYRLKEPLLLPVEGAVWRGGLYDGPEGELLWICREPPAENLPQILKEVKSSFAVSLNVSTREKDEKKINLRAGTGEPSIMLRDDCYDQLLLVKKGQFTETELWSLLNK